jgi:hypothetical protein
MGIEEQTKELILLQKASAVCQMGKVGSSEST